MLQFQLTNLLNYLLVFIIIATFMNFKIPKEKLIKKIFHLDHKLVEKLKNLNDFLNKDINKNNFKEIKNKNDNLNNFENNNNNSGIYKEFITVNLENNILNTNSKKLGDDYQKENIKNLSKISENLSIIDNDGYRKLE